MGCHAVNETSLLAASLDRIERTCLLAPPMRFCQVAWWNPHAAGCDTDEALPLIARTSLGVTRREEDISECAFEARWAP